MVVLQILFIHLVSAALAEGQSRFERVSKSIEIYDPITGNRGVAVGMATCRGCGRELILPFEGAPCVCAQRHCKCCIGIRVKPFKIDKIVCLHLNFNLRVMEFQVQLTVGSWTGLNFTVSAFPLPPICAPMMSPPLPVPLLFCIIIYDVILPIKTEFQSCFSLLLKFAQFDLLQLNIGCVRWGENGVRFIDQVHFDKIVFIKPANKTVK